MRQVWVSLTDLSTVDSRKADEQSAASDLFSLQSAPSAALPQLARIKRKLAVTRPDVEAAAKPRRLKPTSRQSATEVLRYELTCSMEISALHESLALANWEQVSPHHLIGHRWTSLISFRSRMKMTLQNGQLQSRLPQMSKRWSPATSSIGYKASGRWTRAHVSPPETRSTCLLTPFRPPKSTRVERSSHGFLKTSLQEACIELMRKRCKATKSWLR